MRRVQMRISLLILNRNKKNIYRLLCRRINTTRMENHSTERQVWTVGQGNKPMTEQEIPLANHLRLMIEWKGNFQIASANEIALLQLAKGAQSDFHAIFKTKSATKNTEYSIKLKTKSKLHLRHVPQSFSSCKAWHNHSNSYLHFSFLQ